MSDYVRPEGEITIVITKGFLAYEADIKGLNTPFGIGGDPHAALGDLIASDPCLFGIVIEYHEGVHRNKTPQPEDKRG